MIDQYLGLAAERGRHSNSLWCNPLIAATYAEVVMKKCTKCDTVKPSIDFYKQDGTSNQCKECVKAQARAWYAANKKRKTKNSKKWYENNREYCLAKASDNGKIYRRENKQAVKQQRSDWYQANRDAKLKKNAEWKSNNRHKLTAYAAKRRAMLINAMPVWIDIAEIEFLYQERDRLTAETNIIHHVDHIIPINGVNVCGLHVPWNLRVIPAIDNLKKGVSYES